MLPGECAGTEGVVCRHEGEAGDDEATWHAPTPLKLQVCRSFAGYYLGYWCPHCGPYSRESGYFDTEEDAQVALKTPEAYSRAFEEIPGFTEYRKRKVKLERGSG